MFNNGAGNRLFAALFALTLSGVAFATAIVPATPGMGVLV